MYSGLIAIEPQADAECHITLSLKNNAQKEYFNQRIKPRMIGYLQKQLNNSSIDVLVEVTSELNGNEKSIVYTMEDKFKQLAEKNPNLNKLKQVFNLDFD